jgi:5-methylcytosine-specific restriction endonuclease McrA
MSKNKESASARVKARAYLYRLTRAQDRRCFWCDRWIALSADIKGKTIISETHKEIRWLSGGLVLSAGRATTDHVRPLSRGGDSHLMNLVAACWECNNDRGCMTAPSPREQSRRDRQRAKREPVAGTPEQKAWREKVEARRAAKAVFCDHPVFDSVAAVCEFRDKVQRALGVKVIFFTCNRCRKWRIALMNRPEKGKRKGFTKMLAEAGAIPAPEYIN